MGKGRDVLNLLLFVCVGKSSRKKRGRGNNKEETNVSHIRLTPSTNLSALTFSDKVTWTTGAHFDLPPLLVSGVPYGRVYSLLVTDFWFTYELCSGFEGEGTNFTVTCVDNRFILTA